MEWMDEDQQWFRERAAIQEARRHEEARWMEQEAARLMARQPDLGTHPTYHMEDWGVSQEQRQEAQSNALEAQLAREQAIEQARLAQGY